MPASYAHYRFGKLLLPELPADVRQCIQRFRRMYDTGLQGPDLFFYHNIFAKTAVGDLGKAFHKQSGSEFFHRVCPLADTEPAQAYLYGLLAHYCLDSQCHPFINKMESIGEVRHVALESEFDRVLMAQDGIQSPHTHDRSRYIQLTRGECMTAATFFPPATGKDINRCIRNLGMSLRFLGRANRANTEKLVRRFSPGHLEQLIPLEEVEDYAFAIGELQECFQQALSRYPLLLTQLLACRVKGTPLGKAFDPNFG